MRAVRTCFGVGLGRAVRPSIYTRDAVEETEKFTAQHDSRVSKFKLDLNCVVASVETGCLTLTLTQRLLVTGCD